MHFPRSLAFAAAVTLATLEGAPVFSTGGGGGATNDLFDVAQGAEVIFSTPQNACCGLSDPRSALGFTTNNGWVEPTSAIFADGPAAGTVDAIEWQTPTPVNLSGIALRMAQDGPGSTQRGASSFRLFASADGVTFSQISGGTIPGSPGPNTNAPLLITDSAFAGPTANLRAFRLEVTRLSATGVRMTEIDGTGAISEQSSSFLDRLVFNAGTNSLTGRGAAALDSEGPGQGTSFSASSRLNNDAPEEVFGRTHGPNGAGDFLFADGGTPDNGNAIMGDGGETVDFLAWRTTAPVPLAGYRLTVAGDGATTARDAELVRFFVDGVERDLFDNNGFDGQVVRTFAGGVVEGLEFRVEFTRTSASGPRVYEIDALTGPPPSLNIGVVLNEVVSLNDESLEDEDGDSPDWVEILNGSDASVNLAEWGLSDEPAAPFKWTFPAVTLPPRGYLVVFVSGENRAVAGAPLHTNFELRSDGEPVVLTKPDGTAADAAPAARLRRDVSLGRHPNGVGGWKYLATPTPRGSNTASQPYESLVYQAPVFSAPGGFYTDALALGIASTEPDVTLRYTLDGSEPSESSPVVSGTLPVASRAGQPNGISMIQGTSTANQHTDGWKPPNGEVRKASVVRARAFRPNALSGPITTHTYFVGSDAARTDNLPVLAITTPPAGLFDYNIGIYMLGAVFDQYRAANPNEPLTGHTPANYTQRGKAWEREAHLEFFQPGGAPGFIEPAVIDIQGQSSRSFRQKSFGIKARGDEAPDNVISFPIFPDLKKLGDGTPLTSFRHLRLRNFGNDWEFARIRDDLAARLAGGLGVDVMSSRPTSIFLDGEYWGVLTIREQQDARYVQAHYGVDPDEVVILSGPGTIDEGVAGDEAPFIALRNYAETRSLANQADYDYVRARMDVDEFLLYQLCEIYYANVDWPQNNTRMWRRRLAQPDVSLGRGKDGRWRWFLFDIDLGLAHPWSPGVTENTLAVAISPNGRAGFDNAWGTAFLRRLLTNPGFKRDFINTAADLLNSSFQPARATAVVDAMRGELQPAMDEHIRRWRTNGDSVADWQSRVGAVRDFVNQRAGYVRQHFTSTFGLGASSQLTVNVSNPGAGAIRVNRLTVNSQLPGVGAAPYPWTGTYFNTVPVTLEAIPATGWMFAGWSGAASGSTPTITLALSGNANASARFIPVPPKFVSLVREPAEVRIVVQGTPSAPYTLQRSLDLEAWSDAVNFTTAADGSATVVVPVAPGEEQHFFRSISR